MKSTLHKILFWLSPWMGIIVILLCGGIGLLIENDVELARIAFFSGIVLACMLAAYLAITYLCMLFYWFAPALRKIVVFVPLVLLLLYLINECRLSGFDIYGIAIPIALWFILYIPVYRTRFKLKLKD